MSSQQDAMKAGRLGSLAPRPAIAQATAPAGGGMSKFQGRKGNDAGSTIRLDRIVPDPGQPRKTFGTEADGRLRHSIADRGQLVPILVRWDDAADRYVIIDGERRYRAATDAGLADMLCVVQGQSDPDVILELQLITNALREGVDPVEQANAMDRLRKARGLTLRELADKLGIDHSSVGKSLDLLKLDPSVQERVQAGTIPASTATTMVKLDPVEQRAVADRVVDENLSRAETAEVVRQVAKEKPVKKGAVKVKVATSRTFKSGGYTIEASHSKGVDPVALGHALRAFLVEIEHQ